MARFPFRFSRWHRILGAPFGITPSTSVVELADGHLTARFGPWVMKTPVANIVGVEETGRFGLLKTAGPAHLSLADWGLTMATNLERALCLQFEEPVPGIDPFGRIRHPALTVTVDRLDELRRVIEDGESPSDSQSVDVGVPAPSPWQVMRRWARWPAGMALATTRYVTSARAVQRSSETRATPPPEPQEGDDSGELQHISTGVGDVYERVYRITIADSGLTPEQLLDRVTSDFNTVSPKEVAEFDTSRPERAEGAVGEEYRVWMPGPWDPCVRVIDRGPTSLRLATLDGHMEAGEIEFTTGTGEDPGPRGGERPLVFEIRSVARSGDNWFRLVYSALSAGARMQEYMWVHVCERVATIAGGTRRGPVTVHTIRYEG